MPTLCVGFLNGHGGAYRCDTLSLLDTLNRGIIFSMKTHPSDIHHSLGLRIHYFRDLANPGTTDLRTVSMADVPMERHEECDACKTQLSVLCTFISRKDMTRMRLGVCRTCGYIGYMDRPSKEWVDHFYTEEWDNAQLKNVCEDAPRITFGLTKEQQDSVHLVETLHMPKGSVCDIGCGNGVVLEEFSRMGFGTLLGVESSRYRAQLTATRFGHHVAVGNFEDKAVADELFRHRPIDVMYSFHVMEHVYDPHQFLSVAAKLQDDGGYIILAMPDVEHEPCVTTLFWLPHLHAYSRQALEKLLNSHGYEVVADNFSYNRLMIAARKTVHPVARYHLEHDPATRTMTRIEEWFSLNSLKPGVRYCAAYRNKTYARSFRPVFSSPRLDKLMQGLEQMYDYAVSRVFGKFRNIRSLVISRLDAGERITSPEESPLEIQYDGPIEMLVR